MDTWCIFIRFAAIQPKKAWLRLLVKTGYFVMFVLKVLKDLSFHSRTNYQWSICRCLKTKFPRSGSFEPNDLTIVTGKRVVFSAIILEQARAHMQFKMLPSERGINRIKFYRFNQCDNLSALW